MAKYSTGSSTQGNDGEACELCGTESNTLTEATIEGATLLVCSSCAPHDDGTAEDTDESDRDRSSPTAGQSTTPIWDSDTEHWEEEGTDYDRDPLPYLEPDYGDAVMRARQGEGLTLEELAADVSIPEDDLLAVEQGRAARAGVGGSVIETLEEYFDISIAEDE